MSNILSGIPREAVKGQGGIKRVFLAKFEDVTNKVVTAGVASFSVPAGAFKEFNFGKESGSNLAETTTGDPAAGTTSTEQILTMIFRRQDVNKRNEAKILAKSELIGVVEDNNGEIYVIGLDNGLDMTSGAGGTGSAYAESNNLTVTLRGLEREASPSLEAADYTAVKNGTAIL